MVFCRATPVRWRREAKCWIWGVREGKRGAFDIDTYDLDVVCVNISNRKRTDIKGDVADLPFADKSFNAAIYSEMFEYFPDPIKVIKDAHRVLRPGGPLLSTVPFLYRIPVFRHIVVGFMVWFSNKALLWDGRQGLAGHVYYRNHTAGFGIRARKSPGT